MFYSEFFLMKKILVWLFILFGFLSFSLAQDNFNTLNNINATVCKTCTEEWFEYTEYGKCLIPWINPITNSFWTIPVNCNSVMPCISIWWEYYDGWQCCIWEWKLVIDNKCRICSTLSKEELKSNPGRCSENIINCAIWKTYQENWQDKCCPWMVVDDKENPGQKTCIINTEWKLWININPDCLINWQCKYNIYQTLWIRKSDQNPQVKTFVQDIVLAVTMFLGTVIALILITSWILYILAAILWKSSLADMAKKGMINSILWLVLVTGSYALVRLIQFVATAWGW